MKQIHTLAALIVSATLLPACAQAVDYINETFETDTIGVAPADPAQMFSAQVTVAAGTGLIGTDNVARYNDALTTASGFLEYNAGASPLGSMYIQFDLLNNAPIPTGSPLNPLVFGVGNWSTISTAGQLNSSSKRSFAVEVSQSGATGTLKLKSDATTWQSTTYDMSVLNTFKVWVNDNDTSTLSYTRPDTSITASLAANSFVVWINNSLVGAELDSGFAMSLGIGTGNTTGNTTIGRVGFVSTGANLADFLIDNVYVSDVAAVPEPSSVALLLGGGMLLAWRSRRQLIVR